MAEELPPIPVEGGIPEPRRIPIPEGAADYEGEPAGPRVTLAHAAKLRKSAIEKRKQRQLRFDRKYNNLARAADRKYIRSRAGMLGLGALAGLAGGAGAISLFEMPERRRRQDLAIEEFKRNQRQMVLDQMSEQSQRIGLQDSIQRNLQAVQQNAPDLYLQVMTGRRLPQGAVVLGGEPRNDLLQELGRAMAEGQFTR